MLAFAFNSCQQRRDRLIDPFCVQVQLNVLGGLVKKSDDVSQRLSPEAGREKWLYEEDALESMCLQKIQGRRQAIVPPRCWAIDVTLKCVWKFFVKIVPSVAPDLDIHGKKDVQHGSVDQYQGQIIKANDSGVPWP